MTDWTQLEKDLEAHENGETVGLSDNRTALEHRAPDLAALALAGRKMASDVQKVAESFYEDDEVRKELLDALAAFRKAEEQAQ